MNHYTVTLKPGREKTVRHGHPWIFAGAIAAWSPEPAAGDVVDILSSAGEWLARGLADPHQSLAVRVYTRDERQPLDEAFFAARLDAAVRMRERNIYPHETDTDSFRLCFSEADGLSGLIVDRYADAAVIHLDTGLLDPFMPAMKHVLAARGLDTGQAAPGRSRIRESGFRFDVDPSGGQKTGFYLDQRVNRRRAAAYAKDRVCLSAYCYTGAFELHLASAGAARVTGIDSSDAALEQARAHCTLNGVSADYIAADVPAQLRKFRDSRSSFDLIVLDPPKFVKNRGQIEKGLRAYKDINLLAMKLLSPGGILITFSCSGWVKPDTFRTALQWASVDAGRDVRILEQLGQPPDHPALLAFPESEYLCGCVLQMRD